MKYWIGPAVLALLAGCGGAAGDGELSAEEDRELNNAAAMLDDAPASDPAIGNR